MQNTLNNIPSIEDKEITRTMDILDIKYEWAYNFNQML